MILFKVESKCGNIDQGCACTLLFVEGHVRILPGYRAVADEQWLLGVDLESGMKPKFTSERTSIGFVVIGLVGTYVEVAQVGDKIQ